MNNHTKVTIAALVALTMLMLSACGSSGEGIKGTSSGGSAQANVDSKTDRIESSNEDCPLTETQVSAAAGQDIPLFPESAVGGIVCTFGSADPTVPVITITSPGASPTNESVFKPEWGPDAFYTVSEEGNIVIADTGTDGFQIVGVFDPNVLKVDPEAMIIDLGDDLAAR